MPKVQGEKSASRLFSGTLISASLIGLYAAAMLVLEKLAYWTQKANGESTALGCDINPLVGCGAVLNTEQASIFGDLPNPLIGVVAWSMLLAGAVLLASGARFQRWHWAALQTGAVFGLLVVSYLQYSSVYVLGVLCPYCLVTWAVTIPVFWLVTGRNLHSYAPGASWARAIYEWVPAWCFLHFTLIGVLIFEKFGLTVFS